VLIWPEAVRVVCSNPPFVTKLRSALATPPSDINPTAQIAGIKKNLPAQRILNSKFMEVTAFMNSPFLLTQL
jgi:hypothetical protein